MDTAALVKAEAEAVGAGIKAPNEARRRLNLGPTAGGSGPYLQQQNYSLEALAKRDAKEDPFTTNGTKPPPMPELTAIAASISQMERRQIQSEESDAIEMAAIAQLGGWELKSELQRLTK